MREKQTVIQDYRKQKEMVLKALFVPTKKDPVLASDVDCNDIIQAEKMDREDEWVLCEVLKVSNHLSPLIDKYVH